MDERQRSLVTWAAAGVVHAAVLAFALRPMPPRAAEAPIATLDVEPQSEIEVEAPAPSPQAPESPSDPATATETAPPRVAAITRNPSHATAGTSTGSEGAVGGGPTGAASSEPAVAGSNSTWIVSLGPTGAGPGSGTWIAQSHLGISRQQMEADERAALGPRKDDSIKNTLRIQDAAKGLGPDGPVLRALEEETRMSLAPNRGSATFRAIVDATGAVTALNLLDADGDHAGWNDARDRALAVLQRKKLDLKGGNGAMIDVIVESRMRMPDGTIIGEGPVRSVDGRLSLAGDLSNIGAHATRVVHVRLSNYTPL